MGAFCARGWNGCLGMEMSGFARTWILRQVLLGCAATATHAAAGVPEPYVVLPAKDTTSHGFQGLNAGTSVGFPVAYFHMHLPDAGGSTLWRTDGTAEGTHPATSKDFAGRISGLRVPASGGAYFIAADADGVSQVHWTDGTGSATSTRQVTVEPVGVYPIVELIEDRPAFIRRTADGESLLRVDDMQGGVSVVLHVAVRQDRWAEWVVGPSSGLVLWLPREGSGGYRVTHFRWNGSPSVDLPVPPPATVWDYPHAGGAGNGVFCVKAYASSAARLHCTDGTAEGTIRPLPPTLGTDVWIPDFVRFTAFGDRLLFVTHALSGPYRPWITDGTDQGTFALLDSGASTLEVCTADNDGELYFTALDGAGSIGLWRTDGTRPGTRKLAIVSGACNHRGVARALDGRAYIAAGDSLVTSDGTAVGTRAVTGAPPLHVDSFETGYQAVVMLGRWLVFAAPDGHGGAALWRLDLDPVFAGGFD